MRGYQDILVPLDFSDETRSILDAALRVRADDGVITLLHVVEWLPSVMEGMLGVYAHRKDIDKFKSLAREKLEAMTRGMGDASFQYAVLEGKKPATAILSAIEERRPELVVMGTHGRSRLDHLLIGSVAERVVRKAPCPVLLVRAEVREEE